MIKFAYRGRDYKNKLIQGVIEAPSRRDAIFTLKSDYGVEAIITLKTQREIAWLEQLRFIISRAINVVTKKINSLQRKRISKKQLQGGGNIQIIQVNTREELEDIFAVDGPRPVLRKKIKQKREERALPAEVLYIDPLKSKKNIHVPPKIVQLFIQNLSLMLSSGVSLSKTLLTLEAQTRHKKFKTIIRTIYEDIQAGQPLVSAMAKYPRQFDRLCLAMVAIGEQTGTVDQCLQDVAEFIKKQIRTKQTLKKASIYPSIAMFLATVLLLVGSIFFIPIFAGLMYDLGVELPFITVAVFWVAKRIYMPILVLLAMIIMIPILHRNQQISERISTIKDNIVLRLPVIKSIASATSMYYFSHALSLMLKNGIRMTDSLALVQEVVPNRLLKWQVYDSMALVAEGATLAEALSQQQDFTPFLCDIVNVGEESGRMDEVLAHIAEYYSNELTEKVEAGMEWLQPLAILMVAAIVLPIVLAIMLPLLDMQSGQFLH